MFQIIEEKINKLKILTIHQYMQLAYYEFFLLFGISINFNLYENIVPIKITKKMINR